MPILLVAGATGFLGGELVRRAPAAGWRVVGVSRRDPQAASEVAWRRADLTDRSAVVDVVAEVRPDAVVNAATEYAGWAVNADAAGYVAVAAARVGARLVHISTDALFAGRPEPYDESAEPSPVTRYGAAKAAGETAVRAVDPGAAVVRTSLILGYGTSKHERYVAALARGEASGALFTDEYRCPIHVADLTAAVLELAAGGYAGILNVAGPQAVSRYELGRLLAPGLGLDPAAVPGAPSPTTGPPRPTDVRLDCRRAGRVLTTVPRSIGEFAGR